MGGREGERRNEAEGGGLADLRRERRGVEEGEVVMVTEGRGGNGRCREGARLRIVCG